MKKVETKPKGKISSANRAFKQVRNRAGMNQSEYADYLGVSLATVKAVDSGITRCSLSLAAKVEYLFGVDRRTILKGTDAQDLLGKPYTEKSYLLWSQLSILSKTEFVAIRHRTLGRVGLLLDAAHQANKVIAVLAILEEAIAKAANDLILQKELVAEYANLPKSERIPIANSTFDEVTRILLKRIEEKALFSSST